MPKWNASIRKPFAQVESVRVLAEGARVQLQPRAAQPPRFGLQPVEHRLAMAAAARRFIGDQVVDIHVPAIGKELMHPPAGEGARHAAGVVQHGGVVTLAELAQHLRDERVLVVGAAATARASGQAARNPASSTSGRMSNAACVIRHAHQP